MDKNQIELIARAFVLQDGEVLLCKRKDRDYYFFPGGHVESGEFIEEALRREIEEEIDTQITLCSVVGTAENIFNQDGKFHHEVNIVFEAGVKEKKSIAMEDWLEFRWIKFEDLSQTAILPTTLKDAILKWTDDKQTFWIKQNETNG